MSECNIRLSGVFKSYTKAPNGLVYDYRVSDSAVRLYEIMLDFQFKQAFVSGELLARKLKNKNGEAASISRVRRLIRELKQTGWLYVSEQKVYHKDTGAVKTIAQYVLFAYSASAPKSNAQLLEEQAAEIAKEQEDMKNYNGYQPSIGKGFDNFDNIAAELEAQQAAGAIAPIPIVEDVQEQTLEAVAEPSDFDRAIAFVERKTGKEFSEYQKQAIARNYAIDKAGTIMQLNDIMCLEQKAKQG